MCKALTNASLPEIGKSFGGKHHSTVIHSIRKIEDLRQKNGDFNTLINSLHAVVSLRGIARVLHSCLTVQPVDNLWAAGGSKTSTGSGRKTLRDTEKKCTG